MLKSVLYFLPLAGCSILTVACASENTVEVTEKTVVSDSTPVIENALEFTPDTVRLTETFHREDLPVNDYLAEKLKPIRANFKRINTIANWTTIVQKELWETAEGGYAKFYYLDGKLEKIVTRHFGETGQRLTEYYLLNGNLSFVFDKSYHYNQPLSGDAPATEFEDAEIIEERNYFNHGKLLHQINNQDCGSPCADNYLSEEETRIKGDFEKLEVLEKE